MKQTPQAKHTRYRFTKKDCQRGYQAALENCMADWNLYAWFFRRVRGHYRKEKHTQKIS